jgi:hypothetical protein
MSIDIIADAREWLAARGEWSQTHSELCHRWHPACLVSRLLRELDSRAGLQSANTGDFDADVPERDNTLTAEEREAIRFAAVLYERGCRPADAATLRTLLGRTQDDANRQ